MSDQKQYVLDFSSAEADRYRRLRCAVANCGEKLEAWHFLQWVHRLSNDRAGLIKDYQEIGEELFCHRSTAIRIVSRLLEAGLLKHTPRRDNHGSPLPNEYRIDWLGVDAINARSMAKQMGATLVGLSVTESHFATTQSPVATTQSPVATHTKEYMLIPDTTPVTPLPEPGGAEPKEGKYQSVEREMLLRDVPLLREASTRILKVLPFGELTGYGHDVFAQLKIMDLDKPILLRWHCEQLSMSHPFCGPTEADLMLTVAAGLHAARIDSDQVKRNRVALFVSIIARGQWRKVLRRLRDVRELLDRISQTDPKGAYWLQK